MLEKHLAELEASLKNSTLSHKEIVKKIVELTNDISHTVISAYKKVCMIEYELGNNSPLSPRIQLVPQNKEINCARCLIYTTVLITMVRTAFRVDSRNSIVNLRIVFLTQANCNVVCVCPIEISPLLGGLGS